MTNKQYFSLEDFLSQKREDIEGHKNKIKQLSASEEPKSFYYFSEKKTEIAAQIHSIKETLILKGFHFGSSRETFYLKLAIKTFTRSLADVCLELANYSPRVYPTTPLFSAKENEDVKQPTSPDSQAQIAQDVADIKKILKQILDNLGGHIKTDKKIKETNKIHKIQVVRSDFNNQYKIVINNSHHLVISSRKKGSGKLLYDIASSGKSGVNAQEYNDNDLKYWNSAKSNPMYSKTGCTLSPIIKKDNTHYFPGIEIRMITPDTYKRLQKPE